MNTKSKKHFIGFRVNDSELELIHNEAIARNLSDGQTARIVLLDALSGFDQKQEFVLRRLEGVDDKLTLLRDIALISAAAAALPFDMKLSSEQDVEALRKKMRTHFVDANAIGKSLLKMIENGKL